MKNVEKIIKKIIKRFIEDVKRCFHKDCIFSIKHNKIKISFFLPNRYDHIQQQIIVKNKFYENNFLEKVRKYVPKNSVIIDVGANIGNHTIYFGRILQARKIYAFEPQKEVFKILKRNIELNNLTKIVVAFNLALGSKDGYGDFKKESLDEYNLGCASIRENTKGKVKIRRLDSIGIKDKINLIKIDVEGHELQVLLGSKNTIKNNKP